MSRSGRFVVASIAVCLAASLAGSAQAGIMYAELNVAIPAPSAPANGVFVDIDTGTASGASFVGYDVNFYNALGSTVSALRPAGNMSFIGSGTWVTNVSFGSEVNSTSAFATSSLMSTFAPTNPFVVNAANYAGFEFVTTGGETVYGWMQLDVGATMADTTLVGFAYETTGDPIAVGAIPEPTTAMLLLAGALGLLRRRNC